jgi:hypothetical protein
LRYLLVIPYFKLFSQSIIKNQSYDIRCNRFRQRTWWLSCCN